MATRRGPGQATGRVLMWRLRTPAGPACFGALEDGTSFQQLPGSGWATLMPGPVDHDDAYTVIVGATRMSGGELDAGPVEFGFDARALDEVRAGTGWDRNGPLLLIAFDMALRTTGR